MMIASAAKLVVHRLGRPINNKDPIPRENLVSISKLLPEGTLSEKNVLLDWIIDTRSFIIALPSEKYHKLNNFISKLLTDGVTS